MIEPIQWSDPSGHTFPPRPSSPFQAVGAGRPLGLTFHTETLAGAPDEQRIALAALRLFATVPELTAMETGDGDLPRIVIHQPSSLFGGTYYPVSAQILGGGERRGDLKFVEMWPEVARDLVKADTLTHPDATEMHHHLIQAQAHVSLGQDILITLSPWLLERRSERFIKETNPRTPNEAAKIVGLYLRSRRRYSGYFPYLPNATVNHGLFYWVLVCERMPNLWPLLRACDLAGMSNLSSGIFTRCRRILLALDSIGEQFYLMQNRDTIETALYHFDYLLLQLSGVLDALARVTRRVYGIQKPNEREASFRIKGNGTKPFLDALLMNQAGELHTILSRNMSQDIFKLVHTLRNMVHGAGIDTMTVTSSDTEQYPALMSLPLDEGREVFAILNRYPPLEGWGLVARFHRLEPYSFANRVLAEALPLVDSIAQAIDIQRLLPPGVTVPTATSPWGANERRWIPVIA